MKPSPLLQRRRGKVQCSQVYAKYKAKANLEAYVEEIN